MRNDSDKGTVCEAMAHQVKDLTLRYPRERYFLDSKIRDKSLFLRLSRLLSGSSLN